MGDPRELVYSPLEMKVIANPCAGFGRGRSCIRKLRRRAHELGLEVVETTAPGHATELAKESISTGARRLAVMGGDGTISEVVDAATGSQTELAILSVGTGNDVARSLGLPYNDLEASLGVAQNGTVEEIDVGVAGGRHFVSVLGVGFPAQVAAESNRLKWLKGHMSFAVAIYKALWKMKPIPLEIELDDRSLSVNCTSVLVLNTPFTGGGLRLAPDASMSDGLFDIVVIDAIGKLNLMSSLPRVYSGSHLDHPNFSLYRSSSVRIRSEVPTGKMFDGDVCGGTPVEARILPRALKVVHSVK